MLKRIALLMLYFCSVPHVLAQTPSSDTSTPQISSSSPSTRITGIAPDASIDDQPDLPLHDRDHYFIPRLLNTVDVIGNVYNQGAMRFIPDSRVSNYLLAAGGNTREGNKSREFVLRADGSVMSRNQVRRFEKILMHPGDTVVVHARLKAGFNLAELSAYAQLTSSVALAAVAVRALQ